MTTYNVNINQASIELLPPDKRYPVNISLIQGLLKPLQWARDSFFSTYYEGSSAPIYTAGTYAYGDEVIYQKKVYSSLKSANTDSPTVATSWYLKSDNFIGLKERVLFDGGKLVLEYALNKEFSGTFRQPTTPQGITDTKSDIYITNDTSVKYGFFVGQTEPFSSSVGQTTASDYIGSANPYVYLNNFIIHIPTSLLNIGTTSNYKSVSNFVNQYIPSSINFTIVNYI